MSVFRVITLFRTRELGSRPSHLVCHGEDDGGNESVAPCAIRVVLSMLE